jgi:hypothetical protein
MFFEEIDLYNTTIFWLNRCDKVLHVKSGQKCLDLKRNRIPIGINEN